MQASVDEARAWEELHRLVQGQWRNGMLPSIVFHDPSDDYFPGPEHWQIPLSLRLPSTPRGTGITQPPVAASIVRELVAADAEGIDELLALAARDVGPGGGVGERAD